jgi:hypothetical protein
MTVQYKDGFYYKKKTWHILDDWSFVQAFDVRLLTPHQINPVELVLKKPIIKKVPGFLQGLNPTLIS